MRQRVGVVRHLRTVLSRGPLLSTIARALVIGKLQSTAWIMRKARVMVEDSHLNPPPSADAMQVALNDLARVLTGLRRKDHVRQSDLAAKAGIPTVNELVVRQAAVAAWKAVRTEGCPLSQVLADPDRRTRSATSEVKKPISANCVAACNLASTWNASIALREAPTLAVAKKAAKTLASKSRDI